MRYSRGKEKPEIASSKQITKLQEPLKTRPVPGYYVQSIVPRGTVILTCMDSEEGEVPLHKVLPQMFGLL